MLIGLKQVHQVKIFKAIVKSIKSIFIDHRDPETVKWSGTVKFCN